MITEDTIPCRVIIYKDDEAKQWSIKREKAMNKSDRRPYDATNSYERWYEYTSSHSLGYLYQDAANMVTMNGVYIERGIDSVHLDIPAVNRYVIIIFGKRGLVEVPNQDLQLVCAEYLKRESTNRDALRFFAKRSLIEQPSKPVSRPFCRFEFFDPARFAVDGKDRSTTKLELEGAKQALASGTLRLVLHAPSRWSEYKSEEWRLGGEEIEKTDVEFKADASLVTLKGRPNNQAITVSCSTDTKCFSARNGVELNMESVVCAYFQLTNPFDRQSCRVAVDIVVDQDRTKRQLGRMHLSGQKGKVAWKVERLTFEAPDADDLTEFCFQLDDVKKQ
jgi:hypothetical protein